MDLIYYNNEETESEKWIYAYMRMCLWKKKKIFFRISLPLKGLIVLKKFLSFYLQ